MIESLTGQGINVRRACRVLSVSESGYYAWKDRPDPPRTLRRIWLAGEIADVHKASGGTYGEMRVRGEAVRAAEQPSGAGCGIRSLGLRLSPKQNWTNVARRWSLKSDV